MQISINNLKKVYDNKTVLNVEAFKINDGDLLGLVGNNGAGKTTLFRLIVDLIKADDGNVTLSYINKESAFTTVNPAESEDWKSHTGAYIDEGFLIDFLTPEEYFQFVANVSDISADEVKQHLDKFEAFMGGEILGQKKLIRNLSAGNKHKVGIMAALMASPQLVILDEPFNFLDPSLKHLLTEYNKETGATILLSSHNLAHTVDICTRIALLEHGVIINDLENHEGSATPLLEQYFDR